MTPEQMVVESFTTECDWKLAGDFWDRMARRQHRDLPSFVLGYSTGAEGDLYGVTDLSPLHNIGYEGEFYCKHPRYARKTAFAMTISYTGAHYHGYQRQKINKNVRDAEKEVPTVEGDIHQVLGFRSTAAGRTDRGVSAVSQVVSFCSGTNKTASEIMEEFQQSTPVRSGHLTVHDCQRVPRASNARAAATWRRYLYLVPLQTVQKDRITIDIEYMNKILRNLEGKDLPYNAFAKGDDRTGGLGLKDCCTLKLARAFIVDTTDDQDHTNGDGSNKHDLGNNDVPPLKAPAICIELVGSRFLRQMVRKLAATAVRETLNKRSSESVLVDICESGDRLKAARAFPSAPLCLGGVGFDLDSLKTYRFMPTKRVDAAASLPTVRRQIAQNYSQPTGPSVWTKIDGG